MRFYHVTKQSSLPSILEQGLDPRLGERSLECGETIAAVFLFSDRATCEDALMNWLGEAFEEDEPLAIIELEFSGITYPGAEYETMVREHIPAVAIVGLYDEDFTALRL